MLSKLPIPDPALYQCSPSLEIWRDPALCGYFCQDPPPPPRKSLCCAWNPPWVRALSSWARSRSAHLLPYQPPAHCLWLLPRADLSRASCALGWGPGMCLGGFHSSRLPLPFVPESPALCPPRASLEPSAAEKPACWRAGLQPPPLPEPQPFFFVLPSPGS